MIVSSSNMQMYVSNKVLRLFKSAHTAIRILAYGCATDKLDKYLKLGANTSKECLAHFIDGVIAQFSATYLRKSTLDNLQHLH